MNKTKGKQKPCRTHTAAPHSPSPPLTMQAPCVSHTKPLVGPTLIPPSLCISMNASV